MKPLKLPYRIALAGSLSAAAGGLALGAVVNTVRRTAGLAPLGPEWIAGMAACSGSAFAVAYFPPYDCRRRTPGRVYLTFDDGPDPEVTPRILDILTTRQGKATFFILGSSALRCPDLIRRMFEEGHAIAIHGYDHSPVTFLPPGAICESLARSAAAVRRAVAEARLDLYRPTYGLRGPGVEPAVQRLGMRTQLWTLDSRDYIFRSPQPIRQRLRDRLRSGDVVLMHDQGEAGAATASALPGILEDMALGGLTTASLDMAGTTIG